MRLQVRTRQIRRRVARAVHEAVCDYTGSNGAGCCMYYAVVGAVVAGKAFRRGYVPQAGTLQVACDPDSEWGWAIDPRQHIDGFVAGEFHCWFFICNGPSPGKMTGISELVDLSSRHYREFHAKAIWAVDGTPPECRIPDPPEFLWLDLMLPDWVRLLPDATATNQLMKCFVDARADWGETLRLAHRQFEQLAQERLPQGLDMRADRKRKKAERQRLNRERRK